MTIAKIRTRKVKVMNGDLAIDAYVAEPAMEGTFPGIVVIQEIFGVNAHIREVTERIAREGYVAIAPAMYQRQAPGFEAGYTPDDIKIGRQYKEQTQSQELLSDIQATIDYLNALPNVRPVGVGCIGFCFGGHIAYLAATLRDIRATASFYGAGITNWIPGGGEPTLMHTSQIKGTLYAFFGGQDASIPADQVDAIEAALQTHHIPSQVFRYPNAEHGFFCDHRASYNAEAANDAWTEVQALFQKTLANTP